MSIEEQIEQAVRRALRDELPRIVREAMKAPAAAEVDSYLTVAQAAKVAKVKPSTIRTWIKTGRLVAGQRPYRIARADLVTALKRRAAPAAEGVDSDDEARKIFGHLRRMTPR